MNPTLHLFSMSARIRLTISVTAWLGFTWMKGLNPEAATWIEVLLMASILILMPLARGLEKSPQPNSSEVAEFLIGLALAQALLLPIPSLLGTVICGCWFLHRSREAWLAMLEARSSWPKDPASLCQISSSIFPAVGAAWLLAHRLNYLPFDFDSLIVLLTAAHFHHAGFTLPLLAGLAGKALPGVHSRWACQLILAGVPLVAVGITCTHFHLLPWVEPVAVTVLVAGALGVALLHIRQAFHRRARGLQGLWFGISGLSLLAAMLLALSFGLRSLLPEWALPMPAMWAVHGTLNTFGFGLCGILAWRCRADEPTKPMTA